MPSQVRMLTLIAANAIAFAIAAVLLMLGFAFGPDLEPLISPVVRFDKIYDVQREDDRVCWTMDITKVAWADAPHYEFEAEPEIGPPIPVGSYLVDDKGNMSAREDLRAHPVGDHWTRHYCFDIAGRVPDIQRIRVSGHAEHKRHPFWTTVTPIPSFVVCPLGKSQDGKCLAS